MAVYYISSRGRSSHTDGWRGGLPVGGLQERLVSLLSTNFYPECYLLSVSPSPPRLK